MFVLPRTADNIADRKIEAFSAKRRKKTTSGAESQESVLSSDAVDVGNSTREEENPNRGYSPNPRQKRRSEEIEVSHERELEGELEEEEAHNRVAKASANGAYSNARKGAYAQSAESLSFAV